MKTLIKSFFVIGLGVFLISFGGCYTQFSSSATYQQPVTPERYDSDEESIKINSDFDEEYDVDYEEDSDYNSIGISEDALYPEELREDNSGSGEIGLDPVHFYVVPQTVIVSPHYYDPYLYSWYPHHSGFSMHFGFGFGWGYGHGYYDPWYTPYYPYHYYGFSDIYDPWPWWYGPMSIYSPYGYGWHRPHYGFYPGYYGGHRGRAVRDYKKRDFAKRGDISKRKRRTSQSTGKAGGVSKRTGNNGSSGTVYQGGRRERRVETENSESQKRTGKGTVSSGTKDKSKKKSSSSKTVDKRRTKKSTDVTKKRTTGGSSNKGKSTTRRSGRSNSRGKASTSTRSSGSRGRSSSSTRSSGRSSSGSKGTSGRSSGGSSSGRRSSR